jgi:uncharacterized membrane-anchored protein
MPANPVVAARSKAAQLENAAKEERVKALLAALEQAQGSRTKAREILGLSPRQMARLVAAHRSRVDALCQAHGFEVRPYHAPKGSA